MLKTVVRWVVGFIVKILYRVEINGMENYAKAGPRVLIIANHTSFLDHCSSGCIYPPTSPSPSTPTSPSAGGCNRFCIFPKSFR